MAKKSLETRIEEAKASKKRAEAQLQKLHLEELENENEAYKTKVNNFVADLKAYIESSKANPKPITFTSADGTKQSYNMLYLSDVFNALNSIVEKYEQKKDDE